MQSQGLLLATLRGIRPATSVVVVHDSSNFFFTFYFCRNVLRLVVAYLGYRQGTVDGRRDAAVCVAIRGAVAAC